MNTLVTNGKFSLVKEQTCYALPRRLWIAVDEWMVATYGSKAVQRAMERSIGGWSYDPAANTDEMLAVLFSQSADSIRLHEAFGAVLGGDHRVKVISDEEVVGLIAAQQARCQYRMDAAIVSANADALVRRASAIWSSARATGREQEERALMG